MRVWILLAEVSKCVPVRVEADESGIKSREGGGDMLLAKDQGESGIIEHEGEALLWVMRVERDVASTGFENGKQSDDHLKATLHGDTDEGLGANTERDEMVSELIGSLIQFLISEVLGLEGEGEGMWGALDLCFK